MIVRAADDSEAAPGHSCGERLSVGDHLPLVFGEPRLRRFLQADSLGCNDVHQRAALDARKGGTIEILGIFLAAENQAAARAAQRLVRGGRDEVGIGHGTRVHAGSDKARDMRHVHEQQRAD